MGEGFDMPGERLNSVLTEKQREAGFYLEDDEDFVYFYSKEGKLLAIFSSHGATIQSIREENERLDGILG